MGPAVDPRPPTNHKCGLGRMLACCLLCCHGCAAAGSRLSRYRAAHDVLCVQRSSALEMYCSSVLEACCCAPCASWCCCGARSPLGFPGPRGLGGRAIMHAVCVCTLPVGAACSRRAPRACAALALGARMLMLLPRLLLLGSVRGGACPPALRSLSCALRLAVRAPAGRCELPARRCGAR